ncbi:MAG: DUF975 family protein [Gemmiger sp.]|nr:DUF975 family protein [Gemmiger sp.]
MWTRSLLKQNAKQALGGRYWQVFVVCLAATLLGAGGVSGGALLQFRNSMDEVAAFSQKGVWNGNNPSTNFGDALVLYQELWAVLGVAMLLAIVVSLAITMCLQAFLVEPLLVGRARFMMENRQGRAPTSTLFSVFRAPYWNVVKVSFLTYLKIFLGFLVIIPGILWSYQYRMVPFLLAENPYLTTERAMSLSRDMMYGEKWNTFVLELSFFGWLFLCAFTFGLGLFFLEPYYQATFAELYAALRSKALTNGMTTEAELGGFMRYE